MTLLSLIVGGLLLLVELLVARKDWRGWAIYLGTIPLLVWMNVALRLWGLLPMNLAVAWNAVYAIRRWRHAPASPEPR